jgi:hypothetical protein
MNNWVSIEDGLPTANSHDGSWRSDIIWLRYESLPADVHKKTPAEYAYILGKCEWIKFGTPTHPDAARGIENPVCRMVWSQGDPYFTNLHGYPVKATHWAPCTMPTFGV